MRKYTDVQDKSLVQMFCNKCGRELHVEEGFVREGCFHVEYTFGYFSRKDGTKHTWDLCEKCYDEMIQGFALPVEMSEENELL